MSVTLNVVNDPKVFNVTDPLFGAKGDGIADDTAAIQAAILAAGGSTGAPTKGGRVYLPAGTYKITSTLRIKDVMGFKFHGSTKCDTVLLWAGTKGTPRWAPSTPYSAGAQMSNKGMVFIARTGGTTSAGIPPSSSATGTAGFTDGTVVWDFSHTDLSSDLLRVESYSHLEICDMELDGVATSDQTKRPRALLCSYIDSTARTYAPSGLTVSRVRFNESHDSGSPNMSDWGLFYDWGNGELNNSEGYFDDCHWAACGIAIGIDGTQSQDHLFTKCYVESSCGGAFKTYNGGSFCVEHSNLNVTHGVGTIFDLGAPNDRIRINDCISEGSGRILVTGGGVSYVGAPWPIIVENCRFSFNQTIPSGQVIFHSARGPLVVRGCMFDGGQDGTTPHFSLGSSGDAGRMIVEQCAFTWHNSTTDAGRQSIIDPLLNGPGCEDRDNVYMHRPSGDGFTRQKAGTLTFKAPIPWAAGTYFPYMSQVVANGRVYMNVHYPTGGTSSSTGTGPVGSIQVPGYNEAGMGYEADGTCSWWCMSSPVAGAHATDGSVLYHAFEIPVWGTYYAVQATITARSGSSAVNSRVINITKFLTGFVVTLDTPLLGSDSITLDWQIGWP